MRKRRLARLEWLKQQCEEQKRREKERAEKRAYQELLQSMQTRNSRERVRYVKDPDGWPRCPKHDLRTAQLKSGKHFCRTCQREQNARYKSPERRRQNKHDKALGAIYSIRSSLRTLELYGH